MLRACMARLIICFLPLLFSIYLYNYSLVDSYRVPEMAAQAWAVYSCMLEARRNGTVLIYAYAVQVLIHCCNVTVYSFMLNALSVLVFSI